MRGSNYTTEDKDNHYVDRVHHAHIGIYKVILIQYYGDDKQALPHQKFQLYAYMAIITMMIEAIHIIIMYKYNTYLLH